MIPGARFLTSAQLTGSSASLYAPTVLRNQESRIITMLVSNTHTARLLFTLYRVPSGGSAGSTNSMWSACPVEAGQTLVFHAVPLFTLGYGDALYGFADTASKVNIFLFGDT